LNWKTSLADLKKDLCKIGNKEFDFLIVGSGIAGLSFAIKAADSGRTLVVTKASLQDCNTSRAQGGIASAIDVDDSMDQHAMDTIATGHGLSKEDAVHMMVEGGPQAISWLRDTGASFTKDNSGALDLGREGGHSRNRIIHADDLTGAEIERALIAKIQEHPNIQVLENWMAVDLITPHHVESEENGANGPCYGIYAMPADGDENSPVIRILSNVTILSTGGAGQVYMHTTNPEVSTGDGIALAYRAGAKLANLEFFQFHPTSLYLSSDPKFLISEAIRGFGAILVDKRGNRVMEGVHPMLDLAPRDVVARGIDAVLKEWGDPCVFLDTTHLDPDELERKFPNIFRGCADCGIDIRKDLIPVVPAAHYLCGGVKTDLSGRTSISQLYAIGECASTGVHGANRLASNSLLEAVVFAHAAAEAARNDLGRFVIPAAGIPEWDTEGTSDPEEWILVSHDRLGIRRLMWDYVGIVRSLPRLKRAHSRILLIARELESLYRRSKLRPELVELRNLVAVAHLVTKCARFREESRGLHYRTDFPDRNDKLWLKDTLVQRSKGGGKPRKDQTPKRRKGEQGWQKQ
jgi:L-aspartate oxidase